MSTELTHVNGVLNFTPRLTMVESHRVAAVLEKALERLQLLKLLSVDVPVDPAAGTVGGSTKSPAAGASTTSGGGAPRGVGSILDEQRRLEARYDALLRSTQLLSRNPREPAMDGLCFAHVEDPVRRAQIDELAQVSRQLKTQSKTLCRQLKENPNDANNWRKIVSERDELIALLAAAVQELRTGARPDHAEGGGGKGGRSASFEVFAKKVLDEQSASAWADALVRKEKETNQNVKQLQNEVKQERALKEQELEQCHAQLATLKAELRHWKRESKDKRDKVVAETEAALEAQERRALDRSRVTNHSLEHTQQSATNEDAVHDAFARHIEAKTRLIDERTIEWNSTVEREQRRKEEEKHSVEQRRLLTAEQLKKKTDALVAAQQLQAQREEEKAFIQREKAEDAARRNAEYEATTKLQAAIKAMFTRAILAAQKKKALKKRRAEEKKAK